MEVEVKATHYNLTIQNLSHTHVRLPYPNYIVRTLRNMLSIFINKTWNKHSGRTTVAFFFKHGVKQFTIKLFLFKKR